MTEEAPAYYTLSSMPPFASLLGLGDATLLVGVEDDVDGSVKAYLGARYKRTFVRITDPESQAMFKRAWGSGSAHIWLSPVPPAEALDQDPEGDA